MLGGSRVIGLVTARAGSKGIPGKNVTPLAGRPLLAWTVACALEVPEIDRVLVSTDGLEIARVAEECGAEVLDRPAELAADASTSVDVIRHAVSSLRGDGEEASYMVLLQPTSPFRRPADVSDALHLLRERGLDCVVSFTEAGSNPHRVFAIENGVPSPVIPDAEYWRPRQELPPAYEPNGAVYAFMIDALRPDHRGLPFGRTGATVMDRAHSLDIDDELDLALAEALLGAGRVDFAPAVRNRAMGQPG